MTAYRRLRRRVLTPGVSATRIASRGFHAKSDASVALLETVGRSFLTGFGHAAGARTPADAAAGLAAVPGPVRGFAYEGAAMAFAILDGLRPGGGDRAARFIAGPAARYTYTAHIGVGWAFARLPRWRWRVVSPADPLLRWLVLDGYGFHQAYFRTWRYVVQRYRDRRLRWPPDGPRDYPYRVIDQGAGRALWFVGGADPDRVATLIETFPEHRRADLFSGAGLAASYAGGADEAELRELWKLAGRYRPEVAQGCAFACAARQRAGLVTEHTHRAAAVFCDASPAAVAAVAAEARQDLPDGGPVPAFEVWRQRVAQRLASVGRC